jgi:hypothetical protein
MGGQSSSTQTQQSQSAPWQAAQPMLQGILGQLGTGLNQFGFGTGSSFFSAIAQNSASSTSINSTGSFTPAGTISNLGSGQPHAIMQPTIVCNYILRVT